MKLNLNQITPSLSVGEEFKNYNDLCSVLQLKPTSGKSKRLQMKEIERFMSFERQGQKYIIKEIYPVPKEKKDNKRNSKYKDLIEYLLVQQLYELTRNSGSENIDIIYWLDSLTYNLSMRNGNFVRSLANNLPLKEWLDDNNISPDMCQSFYYGARHILKGYIDTALRSLEKNYELGFKKEQLLINSKYSRFLSEEESNWYREAVKETIDSFNEPPLVGFGKPLIREKEYFTLKDVILHKKLDDYYERMSEKIADYFGDGFRIYEVYRISTTSKLIDYAKERVSSYEELLVGAITLNGLICDGMKESKFLLSQSGLSPEQRNTLIDWTIAIDADDYTRHVDALLKGDGTRDVFLLFLEEIAQDIL